MALFLCQHRTADPRAKLLVLDYLPPPIYSIVLTFKLKGSSRCPYIPSPVSRQAAAITPTFPSRLSGQDSIGRVRSPVHALITLSIISLACHSSSSRRDHAHVPVPRLSVNSSIGTIRSPSLPHVVRVLTTTTSFPLPLVEF